MSDATRHGTLTGYNADRCRCDDCRGAYREYRRKNADRIKARMAQYYLDNRERILERNKAYYYANREQEIAKSVERHRRNPERQQAATARWRERNPDYSYAKVNPDRKREIDRRYQMSDKGREYARQWRRANPDKMSAYTKAWRKRHPARANLSSVRVRLMRESAVRYLVTDRDWLRLCARYGWRCCYCGQVAKLTQDHVVPLSRGGVHSIGNLLPACQSCNSSKNDRLLVEWRHQRR